MNILLISPYFRPMVGGVETHLDDLCNFLNNQKYAVYVRTYKAFGTKIRGRSKEKKEYISIHRLWWPDFNLIFILEKHSILKFFYLFTGLFFDCWLFLIRNSKSVSVIQSHGFIAALIGVILGKLFNKRIVVNTHVGFKLHEGIMTKIIKWTLLNADRVLVLTSGIKTSLINLGIPDNKVDIYHYWVDEKKFNIEKNAKKELGWESKFVVLFVGRLIEVKGVRKIFALAKKLSNVTFAIVGLGPLTKELDQISKKYSNMIFLGNIQNEDLPTYYSGSDLLLIPSRIVNQEYEEGIPRVMIEALSCGLPVISTKTGGIPDVFNNKSGKLVDDNFKSIVVAIKRLYHDKNLLNSLSKNCRLHALDLFGVQNAEIIKNSLNYE